VFETSNDGVGPKVSELRKGPTSRGRVAGIKFAGSTDESAVMVNIVRNRNYMKLVSYIDS
jgi:hypothetical protein